MTSNILMDPNLSPGFTPTATGHDVYIVVNGRSESEPYTSYRDALDELCRVCRSADYHGSGYLIGFDAAHDGHGYVVYKVDAPDAPGSAVQLGDHFNRGSVVSKFFRRRGR